MLTDVCVGLQVEVDGRVTTKQLDNLFSQTEYALAVTPIYDEGSAQPMLGNAVTGKNGNHGWIMVPL